MENSFINDVQFITIQNPRKQQLLWRFVDKTIFDYWLKNNKGIILLNSFIEKRYYVKSDKDIKFGDYEVDPRQVDVFVEIDGFDISKYKLLGLI